MKKVNIALITDQNYLIQTAVTIFSAIENKNLDSEYTFYIACNCFNVDICRKLKAFQAEAVKIKLVECNTEGFEKLHSPKENSYCVASPAALIKFNLPNLLKEIDKVLYLDGDIIVREDLSDLFNIELESSFGAVCPDTGSLYSGNANVKRFKNYFNSGVMLLNLKKLREEKATDKLFELKMQSKNESLMDQNVFNEYLNGKVSLISPEYNCLYVNLVRSRNKFTIKDFNEKYHTKFKNLKEIAKKAKIIHYSSKDKPWKFSNIPLADEWFKYYCKYCAQFGYDSSKLRLELSNNYRNDAEYLPDIRKDIVVSLTTFPARIKTVHLTINDILNQTIKPDLIVLYLSKDQFPNGKLDLPKELLTFEENRLTIKFVEDDLRAHKKYLYAFQDYSDKLIITIDDDLRFDRFLIERLIISHYQNPRCIIATRVHLITGNIKKEELNPYRDWRKEYNGWINIPSHQLFATHGAGTLFPPHCINLRRLCNVSDIKSLSLAADDMWLKVNEVLSNTKIVLAYPHHKLNLIDGSQDEALWKTNVIKNENDIQLKNILEKYNRINSKESVIKRIIECAPFPNADVRKKAQTNYSDSNNNQIQDLIKITKTYRDELEELRANCQKLKNSTSWKVGRIVTFVPRFIIKLVKN